MAVRPVVRLPDPVLKQRAAEVGSIDDSVRSLCADLVDTMRASPACVGLAANQIGVGLRVFAVDVTGHRKARSCAGELVLVNPVLVSSSDPELAREGCMSVPDLTGDVARATAVVMRGWTPDGDERVIEADAFEARALLHELDHLDGAVFLDRVASASSVFRRRVYR
ncbi:MAG: peptide deformylase [Actinomycetota bacterium]|jgi:peptide deformylase|nr:peptide deformylase [Actinomycetota bacterium]